MPPSRGGLSRANGQGKVNEMKQKSSNPIPSTASCPSLPNDGSTDASTSSSTRELRKYPMGFAELETLSKQLGDEVVPSVLDEASGFKLLLADDKLRRNPGKMLLVLRSLQRALESRKHDAFHDDIVHVLIEADFFVSLQAMNLNLPSCMPVRGRTFNDTFEANDVSQVAKLQLKLFEAVVTKRPDQAKGLLACVKSLHEALRILLNSGNLKLEEVPWSEVNQFPEKLEELAGRRKKQGGGQDGSFHHPNDFRRVPVFPTKDELLAGGKSANLRPHLIDGPYQDFRDYLDAQFRLLREDLIRPLGEGISQLAKVVREDPSKLGLGVKTGDLNVWVYEDGEVIGYAPQRNSGSATLTLKFKNVLNVDWKDTKRMIPRSLICLSCDNFQTILFATVAGKVQAHGQWASVDIKAESEADGKLSRHWLHRKFLVCQSQGYFEGYRYFLQAMKDLACGGKIPFEKFIVHLQNQPTFPKYLRADGKGLLDLSHFLEGGAENGASATKECVVDLMKDDWPPAEALGLDAAQMNVLRAALTSNLAVVQGPPGTGKTFIGLKIVETILRHLSTDKKSSRGFFDNPSSMEGNDSFFDCCDEEGDLLYSRYENKAWYTGEDTEAKKMFSPSTPTSPILVLCKTNHALDQFLEGILKFTKKIVRIGGQSKNPELEAYSQGKLLAKMEEVWRSMNKRKHSRSSANYLYRETKQKIDAIEKNAQKDRCVRGLLASGTGILSPNAIREIEQDLSIPEDFNVAAFLGLEVFDEDGAIDAEIVGKVLEEEAAEWSRQNGSQRSEEDPSLGSLEETSPSMVEEELTALLSGDVSGAFIGYCAANLFDFTESSVKKARDSARSTKNFLYDAHEKYIAGFHEGTVAEEELEEWDNFNRRKYLKAKADLELSEARLDTMAVVKQLLCLSSASRCVRPKISRKAALEKLPLITRWLLYRSWVRELAEHSLAEASADLAKYERLCRQLDQLRRDAMEELLQRADVVGMTTTGAAKRFELVRHLKAKVVVIEEAAEILEPHVVCSLPPTCEHLILIGDHQQLRSTPAVHELEVKYNLGISLFERLVRNEVDHTKLRTQWRMRPEISALLRPHIYRELVDHRSVIGRPDILGLEKNVFFVTHCHRECSNNADLKSKSNLWEAEFLLGLCQYLLFQGYKKEQITILTGYSGQAAVMRKLKSKIPSLDSDDLRIDLVDNYQGEESDIILLSLVRSNTDGNIGFLKSENRVNVALSRAKNGLYIVGDMGLLCGVSKLWEKVRKVLERQGAIGTALPIKCSVHPDQKKDVAEKDQFPPHGTCDQVCGQQLSCGHNCTKPCHLVDREHKLRESACQQPCEKSCAADLHHCKSLCGLPCPKCDEKVLVTLEECSHEQRIFCGEDASKVLCVVKCGAPLGCGHTCTKACHLGNPDNANCVCRADCRKMCERGHPCRGKCSKPCPPCREVLEKGLPCGHIQRVACYEMAREIPCHSKCEKSIQPCLHPCQKLCSEPCGNCDVLVTKTFQGCRHEIVVPCGEVPSKDRCLQNCNRLLTPCEHPCPGKCGEQCSSVKCVQLVKCKQKALCGHNVHVPCNELDRSNGVDPVDLVHYCKQPCQRVLQCGHECKGTCSTCLNGRAHVPCREVCNRILVCGHRCEAYCGQNCPPCQDKCLGWCEHGWCEGQCGDPCEPCQEICGHGCPHKRPCKKSCHEFCGESRFCTRQCPEELPCRHKCSGFCGDPCPPLCSICNSGHAEIVMKGVAGRAGNVTRILFLPDCRHCIPASKFEEMLAGSGQCGPPLCHVCSFPVYRLKRYQNQIDAAIKHITDARRVVSSRRLVSGPLYRLKGQLLDHRDTSVGTAIATASPKERYWLALAEEVGIESARAARSSWSKDSTGNQSKKLNVLEFRTVSNLVKLLGQLSKLMNFVAESSNGEKIGPDVSRLVENGAQELAAAAMGAKEAFLNEKLLNNLAKETQRLWLLLEVAILKSAGKRDACKNAEKILKNFQIPFSVAGEKGVKNLLAKVLHDPSVAELVSFIPKTVVQLHFASMQREHWATCRNGHAHLVADWPRGFNGDEIRSCPNKRDDDDDREGNSRSELPPAVKGGKKRHS